MISLSKIERWANAERFDDLLDAVLSNGRPLPLALRLRLEQADGSRLSSAGLGLQRVVELSYFPAPAAIQLGRVIAEALVLSPARADIPIAASAVAAAALVDLVAQCEACRMALSPDLECLIEDALAVFGRRLFEAQATSAGGASEGLIGDEIDTAVVLWQAGTRPGLRSVVGVFARLDLAERAVQQAGLWRRAETAPILLLAAARRQVARHPAEPRQADQRPLTTAA